MCGKSSALYIFIGILHDNRCFHRDSIPVHLAISLQILSRCDFQLKSESMVIPRKLKQWTRSRVLSFICIFSLGKRLFCFARIIYLVFETSEVSGQWPETSVWIEFLYIIKNKQCVHDFGYFIYVIPGEMPTKYSTVYKKILKFYWSRLCMELILPDFYL